MLYKKGVIPKDVLRDVFGITYAMKKANEPKAIRPSSIKNKIKELVSGNGPANLTKEEINDIEAGIKLGHYTGKIPGQRIGIDLEASPGTPDEEHKSRILQGKIFSATPEGDLEKCDEAMKAARTAEDLDMEIDATA